MANRVYHWKHGWIPLDHVAALSKAKGNHAAASKMLEAVKHEHLPRDKNIVVAHKSGRIAILDSKTGHSTGIDANVAASLNDKGHHIDSVNADGSLNTHTRDGQKHHLDKSGNAITPKTEPAGAPGNRLSWDDLAAAQQRGQMTSQQVADYIHETTRLLLASKPPVKKVTEPQKLSEMSVPHLRRLAADAKDPKVRAEYVKELHRRGIRRGI